MKNVKIYDVKSSAAKNAKKLTSPDGEHFFWDNNQFTTNDIGDIIFFVNKSERWAFYTVLVEKNINTTFNADKQETRFSFKGHEYVVEDSKSQYENFYKFDINQKVNIPDDWNWTKYLGVVQIYDLWRQDKQLKKIQDRIDKVEDLEKLFGYGESVEVLKQTKSKLNDLKPSESDKVHEKDSLQNQSDLVKEYRNILLTIKTKPFIILAGLSGTGKSRLVRTIAYKTCPKGELRNDQSKPGNFELIKVRPNWHDSTEVVGYESRISGKHYVITEFIRFIVKAWKHPEVPFFLCLDEMNLAPVEQYFAEYLSVFETRKKLADDKIKTDAIISSNIFNIYRKQLKDNLDLSSELFGQFQTNGLTLPENLVVMGTVNMDETTHSFSHKVLDRAMTIEKNDFDLWSGLKETNSEWKYEDHPIAYEQAIGNKISGTDVYHEFSKSDEVIAFLEEVNEQLGNTSFLATYRVRNEFLIYCYHFSKLNKKPDNWFNHALDHMIHMKILPKIEGEAEQTEDALNGLKTLAAPKELKKSLPKIEQMINKLERQRYTSYWY